VLFKLLYIAGAYWWFGTIGIVWGFVLPTVVVLQMIHWIQSVSHSVGGYRRYPTPDDSRNHWLFGVFSLGEGFHHNHHCFPGSARLGLRWWEIDFGYYLLVGLSWLGLVWDIRVPTAQDQYGSDRRAARHVEYVRRELHNFADRLCGGFALIEFERSHPITAASGYQLKQRMERRIENFATQARGRLIAGPFILQRAEEELRHVLVADARATSAALCGAPQLDALIHVAVTPPALAGTPDET
jgi:Fatty acid desaturase